MVAASVGLVVALTGCGQASDGGAAPGSNGDGPVVVGPGADEADFPTFGSLAELSEIATVIVGAEPLDDSKPELVASVRLSDNVTDEYYGKRFRVTDVLDGAGVKAGDEIQVTWLRPRVEIRDSDGKVAEVEVGGAGYASDVNNPFYIFGLSRSLDFVQGENPWGVVASAHGMVAFDRTESDQFVVAGPKPGQDGSLQTALRGRTSDELVSESYADNR